MSFAKRTCNIIKNYFNTLRQINIFALILTVMLSFAISYSITNPVIADWMNGKIPPCILYIEVLDNVNPEAIPNHEVWISKIALGENDDMKSLFDNSVSDGFAFQSADEYGYSVDMIVNTAHEGSTFALAWYDSSTLTCEFWKQNFSGVISFRIERANTLICRERIDLYSDQFECFESRTVEIPEYQFSWKYSLLRWGIISAGTVLIFLVLTILIAILFNNIHKKPTPTKPNLDLDGDANKAPKSDEVTSEAKEDSIDASAVILTPPRSLLISSKGVGRISLGVFFSLMALSIIVAATMSTYIKDISDFIIESTASQKEVVVTAIAAEDSPNGVCLLDDYWLVAVKDENNLFRYCVGGDKIGPCIYTKAEEINYAQDTFTFGDINSDCTVIFNAPAIPSYYLMFWAHPGAGEVSVSVDDDVSVVDTDSATGGTIKIYPFRNSYLPVILRVLIFGIFAVIVFLLLLFLYYHLFIRTQRDKINKQFLFSPYKKRSLFLIWPALYVVANIQYAEGICNYLSGGDQIYYWGESLYRGGVWWHPDMLASLLACFRGIFCNVPTFIAHSIGDWLQIDPVLVYLIFTSFAVAWLSGYVFPEFYSVLSEKIPKNYQVILNIIIHLFFWNGTLTAVLVDLFGTVSFLTGVLFVLKLLKQQKIYYGITCGVCLALACNLRTAYKYGIYVLVAYGLCMCSYYVIKHRKELIIFLKRFFHLKKKVLLGLLVVAVSFVLVSLPQLQINAQRGNYGLLPYDEGNGLMSSSAQYSLINYTGYPAIISDDQLQSMIDSEFGRDDAINMPQIFTVYSNNFVDTIMFLLKKMFIALDVKTSTTYPSEIKWRESYGMIYSMLNYIALASAIYVLMHSKQHVTKSDRIIMVLLFLGLPLPQMMVHVEWRYFLTTYLLLYYFFSFHFTEAAVDNIGIFQSSVHFKYLRYICIVLCVAFAISFTIWA